MAVNTQKIKKWTAMLLGKSSYHVNQDEGKAYSIDEIRGYYNNLTEKITRFGRDDDEVPSTVVDSGKEIFFSIAIFQYGLAAYDLYLLENDKSYLRKVFSCSNWAINNQQEDGSWVTFEYESPDSPYSSMAQGEGISLLLRAYLASGEELYLAAAQKAFRFMVLPIDDGGTAKYCDDDVYFFECTDDPLILNGWIFSLWGLLDYHKFFKDEESGVLLQKTVATLKRRLPDFDNGYWSMYEDGTRICSPFYHSLHVAQLASMFSLTGEKEFLDYSEKWAEYEKHWLNRTRAFVKKAVQKVFQE